MEKLKDQGFVYLGGPYTHRDPGVRAWRFKHLTAAAAYLLNRGFVVHSPITHGHVIASSHEVPESWEFWRRQSLGMLDQAAGLIVLPLPGWRKSVGLADEIEHAMARDKPIHYITFREIYTG